MKNTETESSVHVLDKNSLLDQNSRNLLDIHSQRFIETSILANKVKVVIQICMSENIFPHPTVLAETEENISEMLIQVEYLHDNHGYNIVMCIGETIDKFIKGSEFGKTVFEETITRYYELGMPEIFEQCGIKNNLCPLLKNYRLSQLHESREETTTYMSKLLENLTNLINGCSFLGMLKKHPALQSAEAINEVISNITRYIVKSMKEIPSLEDSVH